jgi:biopolymer transport protein ExbB
MKRAIPLIIVLVLVAASVFAQDIREAARKATEDREATLHQAQETEARILADRSTLTAEVEKLERQQTELEAEVAALSRRVESLSEQRITLSERWAQKELEFQEISGNIHVAARDLEALLRNSLTSAYAPGRLDPLNRILREGYFPDIEDISGMASLCFDEIRRSGEVALYRGAEFKGRNGQTHPGTVLRLGNFTAAYRDGNETGFLQYVPEKDQLSALSALPSGRIRKQINKYLDGKSDDVPIDFSGGLALRQITQRASLVEQLKAGGPIVYPILLIALFALIIVVERTIYLRRVHKNTDQVMKRIDGLISSGDWEKTETLIGDAAWQQSPVVKVLRAGLTGRQEDRETLENILQEAILREVPRLERFLPVLSVLGTIAPLLGLLGTVTGMISTFQVITLHGTGNPRLMSGGISEALVTTELGLAVAIPIMLVHVILSRRVNRLVGEMEEKAIALTNIIHKERVS